MNTDQNKGIIAQNQDFSKYDQVKKDQKYQLVEDRGKESFDEDYMIQTCDMQLFFNGGEAGKKKFAQQLGAALEGIGFAILTGHGIDPEVYAHAHETVRKLFETTTVEERMPFHAARFGSVNQGYFPIKETTIIHPDLVEGWVFCRRAFDLGEDANYNAGDYWPEGEYEQVFRNVVQQHEALVLPVMQSVLSYLGVNPHLYDERLTKTNFGFRLNYYPPISEEEDKSGAGRMLGHEDVDFFTLLPAQDVEGLQVFNRENGKWIRLNAPKGSIILNTGDYMQRITNDRLPSTTHRVSKPANKAIFDKPRISIPMAIYVWEDEILEVLPGLGKPHYEPISAIKFHTNTTSKYYGDAYAVDGE